MATPIENENTQAIAELTQAVADLEAALANERARAMAAETSGGTYTDARYELLVQAIGAADIALRAYVDAKTAKAVNYCGQKPTVYDLPTNAARGDMWDVAENGHNYVWNGTSWDDQGGSFDTSGLVQLAAFQAHLADVDSPVSHITQAERTLWNSGVTVQLGSYSQVEYGSPLRIWNTGPNVRNAVFNFEIPKGKPFEYSDFTPAQLAALKGAKGDPGSAVKDVLVGTVQTVAPNTGASVTVNQALSTDSRVVFDFKIPRGYSPYLYASATALAAGEQPTVNIDTTQDGDRSYCSIRFGIPKGDPGYIGLTRILKEYNQYQLIDDTSNLIELGQTEHAIAVKLPHEYWSTSRTAGAHEFLMVLHAPANWTSGGLAITWKKYSSSETCVLHLFDAAALSTAGLVAGGYLVFHFAEMFDGHYMVSSKDFTQTFEVTET